MKFLGEIAAIILFPAVVLGGSGDPQIKTDHPWYPGELAMSTFERLAETQAAAYERVTGRKVETDEDRALASWFWRNLHYAHGEEGRGDLFDEGFEKSDWNRDYWQGLFAHGYALCGTTHAQWTAEMNSLLGHCRSRAVGVTGHNSFEVFLRGREYGDAGRWALLDHDLSTVVFGENGRRLLSIEELIPELKRLGDPAYRVERQHGWLVSGLYPGDINAFKSFRVAEYLAGYAGPPPMVHLRSGETLRRYLNPGLEDGKTFVFWGRNYRRGDIPGPERSRTWVNQPEAMFEATRDAGHVDGRFRYANAEYVYRPDFTDGRYREGVIDENDSQLVFEFQTPYVIAATPPDDSDWGIYQPECRNGLVVSGQLDFPVAVSTDRGKTWNDSTGSSARPDPVESGSLDFTDSVKGHQQYWLRFGKGAEKLKDSGLEIRTVCQMNPAVIPRLHDGENQITFQATGQALVSAGPNRDQAQAHVVEGDIDSKSVTLKLEPPRSEKAVGLHAASHNRSGSPPDPEISFRIEVSTDDGRTWKPVVEDWKIERRGSEPGDFWSQSFTYGSTEFEPVAGPVGVRFSNDGGKKYRRVEAHLVYEVADPKPVTVKFAWTEGGLKAPRIEERTISAAAGKENSDWKIRAGSGVETLWVEMEAK